MSSKSAEIAALLRKAITEHQLPPGTKISEQDTADIVGVSRIVVRQSIIRLSEDGLVEIHRNRGAFVAAPGPQVAIHLFEAIGILEQGIVSIAVEKVHTRRWQALRQHTVHENDEKSGINTPYIHDNEPHLAADFHRLWVGLSDNKILIELHASLVNRALALGMLYPLVEDDVSILHDHNELLDLIERGEQEAARQLIVNTTSCRFVHSILKV